MPADHAEEIALEEKVALLEPDADVLRDADSDDVDLRPPRRRRRLPWLLALGVALALALALALGYWVAHPRGPELPTRLQPSRHENFVLDGLRGQPPQTREYDFVVSQVEGAPDGVRKPMLVVNGVYPGPTIEANQHDRIVVKVTNMLENRTTIHWHGLFQNGTNYYDGTGAITECGIPPGQSLTYNFTLGEFSGTTWWHAHSTQYTDGITGALIVHPSEPAPPSIPAWDEDLVIQVSDLYHIFSPVLLKRYLSPWGVDGVPGDEPVPDSGTLNGLGQWAGAGSYFNFTLAPHTTYRLRLLNTGSFASIRVSVDAHAVTLIEADGTLVQPHDVAGVTLAVAQRCSVLLRTADAGAFWVRAEMQRDMFKYDLPGQNRDIRGVIRYGNEVDPDALPAETDDPGVSGLGDADTDALVPAVPGDAPAPTRLYKLRVSLQLHDSLVMLGFMNTTSWEPLRATTTLLRAREAALAGAVYGGEGGSLQDGEQFLLTEDSVQVVDLVIDNIDDGDHPFHLHGHRPWIVGSGAGRYIGQPLNGTNALRRDTVLIKAYHWTALRFVTDNPGMWAFHCHLAWHMAAGMLMQVNSLPSRTAALDIPQAIVDQCQTEVGGAGARR
ncbi:multicopper oxidase [Phanerochaete sordida]|uniref:laccase n=1 Tax=Phanerochaete sordida TaxID=48140 RepID=A0A9P3GJ68_9APHY|nr:multicopper oxidase [Phanerochaete sordida]